MKQEKILKKLMKKAKEINNVEISPENLTKSSLEDLYKAKGKIYHCNGVLYRETKKNSKEWLFLKSENSETPEEPILETEQESSSITEQSKENSEILERIKKLEKWAFDTKNYIDNKFNSITLTIQDIKKEQEEVLGELKEYVDNKTKK